MTTLLLLADLIYIPKGWVPCAELEPWSLKWIGQMCYLADNNAAAFSVVGALAANAALTLWMRSRTR